MISPASDDRVRATSGAAGRSRRFADPAVRVGFVRFVAIDPLELNGTLTFCEAEIKNAF